MWNLGQRAFKNVADTRPRISHILAAVKKNLLKTRLFSARDLIWTSKCRIELFRPASDGKPTWIY